MKRMGKNERRRKGNGRRNLIILVSEFRLCTFGGSPDRFAFHGDVGSRRIRVIADNKENRAREIE
jgi:hypothetical protein